MFVSDGKLRHQLCLPQAISSSSATSTPSRELGALCIRTKTHLEDATRVVTSISARRWYHKLRSKPTDSLQPPIDALRTCIDQAYALCNAADHAIPSQRSSASLHGASREPSHASLNNSRQPSSPSLGSMPSAASLIRRMPTSEEPSAAAASEGGSVGSITRWPSISGAVRRTTRTSSGVGQAEQVPLCVIRDGKVFSEVTCVLYVPSVGSYQGGVWISVKTKALGTHKLLW